MAGLKLARNKYVARVRKWNGVKQIENTIPLNTTNRTEALERLLIVNRYEKDIKNGIDLTFPWMNNQGELKVVRYTLGQAIDEYISARRGENLRQGTIDIYLGALTKFSRVCGKNTPTADISSSHINKFKLLFQSNSNETANINIRALITFLKWLFDNNLITDLPKIKTIQIQKKLPTYFNENEWNNILELNLSNELNKLGKLKYPDIEHYKKAWEFYHKTGCRLSEPFSGIIDGNWLTIDETTSKTHIQREVFIPSELKGILIEMRSRLEKHLLKYDNRKNFIKRYSRMFKYCCIIVGLNDKHFHHIRHTFAVRRYLETRDIYLVAKELGHSSVTTTEIYTKFNLRKLKDDFPSLLSNSENNEKYTIRGTDFRDTMYLNSSVARG